jgi:Right handed beta helix region
MHLMKRKVISTLAAALVALSLASGAFAGPLDPPADPGSTTPPVEPRTPIPDPTQPIAFPIMISEPGSHYLTQNLTGTAGVAGIVIAASNVTLDLSGFTLTSVSGARGIWGLGAVDGVTVRNGFVAGWDQQGIDLDDGTGCRVENIHVVSVGGNGIRAGDSAIVTACVVSGSATYGIDVNSNGHVSGCAVHDCGLRGIDAHLGSVIRDCVVTGNRGIGIEISGGIVEGCIVSSNASHGIHALSDSVVRRCVCVGNDTDDDDTGTGVRINGSGCLIQDNHINENRYGVETTVVATDNVIVRNSALNNGTVGYLNAFGEVDTTDNSLGPLQDADNAAASPWANFRGD